MRFKVDDGFWSGFMPRHLRMLGHEIVESNEDFHFKKKEVLPRAVIESLGFKHLDQRADHSHCRFFDWRYGWSDQLLLIVPIVGMMDGGFGKQEEVGSVGQFVPEGSTRILLDQEFRKLSALLREMQYSGLVQLEGLSQDKSSEPCKNILLGELGSEIYSFLQGSEKGGFEWFVNPQQLWLKESTTVNLLVSRFPFPQEMEAEEINVGVVQETMEKHAWFAEVEGQRGSTLVMKKTALCVVTNWGWTLRKAVENALWTARNLDVKEIQYRTDIVSTVERVITRLSPL